MSKFKRSAWAIIWYAPIIAQVIWDLCGHLIIVFKLMLLGGAFYNSSHVEFNLKTSLIRTFPCSAMATWKLSNFSFSIVFVQVTESSSPNGSPSYKALSLYLSNIICKSCCRLRGIESVKGIRIEFNVYHMETLISCQMRMVQNWITKKSPKRLASKSLLMISSLY